MRRAALCLVGLAACGAAAARPQPGEPAADAPPHAWLFGSWTGGLFPVLDGMVTQDCSTQPTVRFSRDAVSHATLLDTTPAVRTIITARATDTGAELRFQPDTDPADGFGCENPDELHIERSGANEISFPRCTAFPYPLQRCPAP